MWDVKNDFAYVLQFFSLISDGLGTVCLPTRIWKPNGIFELVDTSSHGVLRPNATGKSKNIYIFARAWFRSAVVWNDVHCSGKLWPFKYSYFNQQKTPLIQLVSYFVIGWKLGTHFISVLLKFVWFTRKFKSSFASLFFFASFGAMMINFFDFLIILFFFQLFYGELETTTD